MISAENIAEGKDRRRKIVAVLFCSGRFRYELPTYRILISNKFGDNAMETITNEKNTENTDWRLKHFKNVFLVLLQAIKKIYFEDWKPFAFVG